MFRPLRMWWRGDRLARPLRIPAGPRIAPDDAWCEDPADRHYNQPIRFGADSPATGLPATIICTM